MEMADVSPSSGKMQLDLRRIETIQNQIYTGRTVETSNYNVRQSH